MLATLQGHARERSWIRKLSSTSCFYADATDSMVTTSIEVARSCFATIVAGILSLVLVAGICGAAMIGRAHVFCREFVLGCDHFCGRKLGPWRDLLWLLDFRSRGHAICCEVLQLLLGLRAWWWTRTFVVARGE